MAKTFIITSASSGSGKTTTALNLALCWATLSKNVLLVDLNPQGWLRKLMGGSDIGRKYHKQLFLNYLCAADYDFKVDSSIDYVIVDISFYQLTDFLNYYAEPSNIIVPVEAEYYGMNELSKLFEALQTLHRKVDFLLPVMTRESSEVSIELVNSLQRRFGKHVYLPAIQRNYYLAHQKDFKEFDLIKLTNRAAVTYLNFALYLSDLKDKENETT